MFKSIIRKRILNDEGRGKSLKIFSMGVVPKRKRVSRSDEKLLRKRRAREIKPSFVIPIV